MLTLLDAGGPFAKTLGELQLADTRTRLESLRYSVEIGACTPDDALLIQAALHQYDRDRERQLAVVAASGGNTLMAKTFMTTLSQLGSRQADLEGAIIELRRLAETQAAKPLQKLTVQRDKQGNAISYTQQPVDADVPARDFIQQVAELHKRARGSNGSG